MQPKDILSKLAQEEPPKENKPKENKNKDKDIER